MNLDMFSVMLFTDETIGLMPIGFLCIFFNWTVLWSFGGLQKLTICHGMSLELLMLARNLFHFLFGLFISF